MRQIKGEYSLEAIHLVGSEKIVNINAQISVYLEKLLVNTSRPRYVMLNKLYRRRLVHLAER